MKPRGGRERPTHVRVDQLLTVAGAMSLLVGCGQVAPDVAGDQSEIAGRVLLGPQCPVETAADPCPDEPASGAEVTVAEQLPGEAYAAGKVVARTTTEDDGTYRVAVPPGTYVVTSDAGMSCELMDVRVAAGTSSTVEIPCDTGIR